MNRQDAIRLIRETFENPFDEARFARFARELFNELHTGPEAQFSYTGQYIKQAYRDSVRRYDRLGKYTDPNNYRLDVLVVYLGKSSSLERARTMQRNFVADYLRGRGEKDAALVAYVVKGEPNWRFSFVRMDYQRQVDEATGKVRIEEKLTPARRFSFLVGAEEPNHTAQQQLLPVLQDDARNPTLEQLEEAFSIEKVSKAFFDHYKERFLELREELDCIRKQNAAVAREFDARGLDTAQFAKKLLGQIVFLYFLQKKGWLGVAKGQLWGSGPKNFLSVLFHKGDYENFFDEVLEPLFYEALAIQRPDNWYPRLKCKIPFLNGGLFEPIGGYDWRGTEISIDNAVFKKIFETFDLYNFTVREDEPLEKEVAVDPEMLGKVFERLLDVRDRKSKGAFYTPREIVHYMCQESLINYLDTAVNVRPDPLVEKPPVQADLFGNAPPQQEVLTGTKYEPVVPRTDLETLIRKGELAMQHEVAREDGVKSYRPLIPESVRAHAAELDAALAEIKVCDPAVGSGAFPVGMMHEIVRARLTLTPYLPSPMGRGDGGEGDRTPYAFKRHAIQESLYGVDIDPAAVDIAKLRLWLSLVVDEENYEDIKPLPNLDYKIVVGNSLLGYPYQRRGLEKLEALKDEFFDETDPEKKQALREQIDQELTEIFRNTKQSLGYQVDFDFRINFSEAFRNKDGFDVIIGNPPYVRHERIKELKPALREVHPDVYQGTADLYVYFYSQGVKILRPGGFLTFISSNKFMRASYGKKLRRLLSQDVTPKTVIDFGDLPVFDATTYPCIVSVKKSPLPSGNHVTALTVETVEQIRQITVVVAQEAWQMNQQQALTVDGWRLESPEILHLLEKLHNSGVPLGEYVHNRFYYGIKTGYNQAFVIDCATRNRLIAEDPKSAEIIKPFLRGRDVKRWVTDFSERYLIKIESSQNVQHPWSGKTEKKAERIFAQTYPAIYAHFQKYKSQLMKRQDKGKYFWELRACAYWGEFGKTKIVWGNMATRPKFAFADTGYYVNAPANVIVSDSKYLLGILNSKVTQFLVYKNAAERAGGFLEFKPMYIAPLAIPPKPRGEMLTEVVARILDEIQVNSTADISTLEAELNRLVYALYGLSDKEIDIIERTLASKERKRELQDIQSAFERLDVRKGKK